MNKGYSLVGAIMQWYAPRTDELNGVSPKSVELVSRFLAREKHPITLYEAGTGAGFGVRSFLTLTHVSVRGCDVVASDLVKDLMLEYLGRISIDELTLYDSLKGIDDGSIDVFYADNVIEHMFPDEFPAIMELLSRKLKPGALLFLFIPNSVCGPRDISGRFLKMGHKAEGFHFMEMTCREVFDTFGKYGIVPAYFTFRTLFKNYRCIKDSSGILNRFKLVLEMASNFIPSFMRIKAMELFGLTTYILQKKA